MSKTVAFGELADACNYGNYAITAITVTLY